VITPKPETRIENIVATVIFEHQLDLDMIEQGVPNIEYNPDQFPGLILRLDSPKVTALIFRSGKMVVTGAKRTADLIKAVKKILRMFVKSGVTITGKPKIQIQNIVASANLGMEVLLEKAAYLLENTMYEPEQFPGLILRLTEPRVVLLIFSSGKMVITGAKSEEEVEKAVNHTYNTLVELNCLKKIEKSEEAVEKEITLDEI